MDNFETKLENLEDLSEKIKNNDLPLEEALEIFEKGINLAKGMEKDLAQIESKIQILMNQPVKESDKSDSADKSEKSEKSKKLSSKDDEPVLDLFSGFEG